MLHAYPSLFPPFSVCHILDQTLSLFQGVPKRLCMLARALTLAFAFAFALCRLATVGDPRDTNNDYASTTWNGSCCHMVRLCRSSADHNNCGSVLKIHTTDISWAAILLPTHSRTLAHTFTYANQSLSPLAKGWQAAHADDAIFDCLTFAPTGPRTSLLLLPLPHTLLLYLWHVFFNQLRLFFDIFIFYATRVESL